MPSFLHIDPFQSAPRQWLLAVYVTVDHCTTMKINFINIYKYKVCCAEIKDLSFF